MLKWELQRIATGTTILSWHFFPVTSPSSKQLRNKIDGGQLNREGLRNSLRMLSSDSSSENLPLYLKLLSRQDAAAQVIPLLARFNDSSVPDQLLMRLPEWNGAEQSAAMEAWCGMSELGPVACSFANQLAVAQYPAQPP